MTALVRVLLALVRVFLALMRVFLVFVRVFVLVLLLGSVPPAVVVVVVFGHARNAFQPIRRRRLELGLKNEAFSPNALYRRDAVPTPSNVGFYFYVIDTRPTAETTR